MVSTSEKITDESPSLPMIQTTVKKPSARKLLCFSPKYLMLKRELLSVLLELQNKDADPINLNLACGKIKQNKNFIQKSMIRLNVSFIHR